MLVGATGFEPVLVHFLQPAILLHFFETLDFTAHFIVCMCNKIGFNSTHYIPMQHEMQHENFMKMIQYFPGRWRLPGILMLKLQSGLSM